MSRSFCFLVLLVFATRAFATDFYPLQIGGTWVYAYHNVLAYSGGANSMTNITEGKMTVRVVGTEITNGVTYTKTETTYENIFGMTPQTQLLRENEKGVFIAGVIRDEFYESPLLLLPPEPDKTWDYFDGEKGQRKIVEIGPVTVGEKTYKQCVRVTRIFDSPDKQKMWTNESCYAPGFGEVQFRFVQRMGPTLSETKTTLLSYTPP